MFPKKEVQGELQKDYVSLVLKASSLATPRRKPEGRDLQVIHVAPEACQHRVPTYWMLAARQGCTHLCLKATNSRDHPLKDGFSAASWRRQSVHLRAESSIRHIPPLGHALKGLNEPIHSCGGRLRRTVSPAAWS